MSEGRIISARFQRPLLNSNQIDHLDHAAENDMIPVALLREELSKMLLSRHFRTSRRSKEFLLYVVNQKIDGNGGLLKERLIGVQIFGRKPDYAVGEDPVVRVLAGEVRHRLERYHADPECCSDIVIQIPLGSYAPVFHLRKESKADELSTGDTAKNGRLDTDSAGVATPPAADSSKSDIDHGYVTPTALESPILLTDANITQWGDHQSRQQLKPDAPLRHRPRRVLSRRAVVSALVFLILAICLVLLHNHKRSDPTLKAFWLPASVSAKPVLLWLPKPMLYRPSDELFEKYAKSHPGTLVTRETRQDEYLPLQPSDTIQWGDMVPVNDSGPGIGGVIAAVNMSRLLTQQGIRFEIRFGPEATYAEMRDSPAVIVGAINTKWATQLTSESNFAFDESITAPNIYEKKGARRVWKMEVIDGHKTRDYGLITRQLSGRTGQFLVQVAGISHFGTEAASEMLLEDEEIAKIMSSESIGLKKRNLQIVVSTDITDGRAGPPQVVAVSSW